MTTRLSRARTRSATYFGRIPVRLIPIEGAVAEHLLQEYPYYAASVIPHEHYPQALNSEDVRSVGVKTTFVASTETPENVVYAITREVFENFDDFKQLHPAYRKLTRRDMLKGLSAPLHPGARTYYREAGLALYAVPYLMQRRRTTHARSKGLPA